MTERLRFVFSRVHDCVVLALFIMLALHVVAEVGHQQARRMWKHHETIGEAWCNILCSISYFNLLNFL
jgi:hypothetical protein